MGMEIKMTVNLIGIVLVSIAGSLYFRYEASKIENACIEKVEYQFSNAEICKKILEEKPRRSVV